VSERLENDEEVEVGDEGVARDRGEIESTISIGWGIISELFRAGGRESGQGRSWTWILLCPRDPVINLRRLVCEAVLVVETGKTTKILISARKQAGLRCAGICQIRAAHKRPSSTAEARRLVQVVSKKRRNESCLESISKQNS